MTARAGGKPVAEGSSYDYMMISQTVKKCGVCQREYPLSAVFCPIDGSNLVEEVMTGGDVTPTEPLIPASVATDPDDPLVGSTIERYHIMKRVGRGGMGSVYRAIHTELNRAFAVKVIRNELGTDEVAIRRFRREALALGALTHPHAVNVTDFGVTKNGLAFLVMEYLEGIDLRQVIVREAPMNLSRAATIFSQICAAVSAAHRVGIVHRDLKPENIMLVEGDSGEIAKVLDFGIARLASSENVTGRLTARDIVIGTPTYMSPEACQGLEQTGASDIYALGVILFEMITGHFLYESTQRITPFELAARHVNEAPPAPSSRNPGIPPEIDAIVLRALAKKPEERQPTALDLGREFESAVSALRFNAPVTADLVRDTGGSSAPVTQRDLRPQETVPNAGGETPAPASVGASVVAPPIVAPEPAPKPFPYGVALAGLAAAVVLVVAIASVAIVGMRKGWFGATPAPEPVAPTTPTAPTAPTTPTTPTGPPPGMVLVPAGRFAMGEAENAVPRAPGEPPSWPAHSVDVKAFYLDVHEITNGEYEAFVKATGAPEPPSWSGKRAPNWKDLPVAGVTWVDADNYARWSGKRLPTEQEWEYAARGTDGRVYPWGAAWDPAKSVTARAASAGPDPVGSHHGGASPFGVEDLAGNVWEWTASNYSVYPGGPDVDADLFTRKVIRGGSFASSAIAQRSTNRAIQEPYTQQPLLGFRCAKSIEQ